MKEAVGRWPSSIGRVRNVLAPIFNLRSPGEKIKEELGQEFAELTRVAPSRNTTEGTIKTIGCGGEGIDSCLCLRG